MWLWSMSACLFSPQTHEGRPVAPVMSWWFADWLERTGRAEQEGTDALIAALPVAPGDVVADLGCGTGFHARRLSRVAAEVHCVDLQPQMLSKAQAAAAAEGVHNVRYVLGQADSVPLAAGSVDLVLMVDVYHELAEPRPMLASIRDVLAPDGLVAVVEFRLEGDTALFVKEEHRMSADQVVREWTGAGFALERRVDSLPTQHLHLFRPE